MALESAFLNSDYFDNVTHKRHPIDQNHTHSHTRHNINITSNNKNLAIEKY